MPCPGATVRILLYKPNQPTWILASETATSWFVTNQRALCVLRNFAGKTEIGSVEHIILSELKWREILLGRCYISGACAGQNGICLYTICLKHSTYYIHAIMHCTVLFSRVTVCLLRITYCNDVCCVQANMFWCYSFYPTCIQTFWFPVLWLGTNNHRPA